MTCIHTGCDLYITEYGVWAHGDAHTYDVDGKRLYLFRISFWNHEAPVWMTHVNYTVHELLDWWDKDNDAVRNSTLLADAEKVTYHGYRQRGQAIWEHAGWLKNTPTT